MKRVSEFIATKSGEYTLTLIFFFLLAALFTWPLILHVHNGVLGGTGDPMLNSWIISWDAHTIFSHPSRLFQGNIIYPARDVLAYSEHMLTLGIISAPVYFIFHNPVLSYNFLVFFAFVLSGFGCYLLIKELTGSRWAGLAGGVFFALCPYKLSKLSHLQILFSPFLPFMLLYLYRFLKKGGARNAVLFGVFFLAQSLSSWHYLVFCSFAAALMWLWTAAFSRDRERWRRLVWTVVVLAVALAVILPFTVPYLRAHSRLPGFERPESEVKIYGSQWEDYLTVLPESVVYGDAPPPFHQGGIGYENVLYPGVTIIILALAGLFLKRREEDFLPAFDRDSYRMGALYFLLLAGLSFILTFGLEVRGISNIFYSIPYRLGLLKFIRVPARFYVTLSLGLAVLGGYGLAKLAARSSREESGMRTVRMVGFGLALILVLELMTVNMPVYRVPTGDEVPEVYNWLSEQGDVRVIELPTVALKGVMHYDRFLEFNPFDEAGFHAREGLLVYYSTYHWKEIANGYSGYFPFFYNRIFTEMQAFPSQRTLALLRGLGIDYVIWDWSQVPTQRQEEFNVRLFSTPGLEFVGDFGDRSVFAVEPGETAPRSSLEMDAAVPEAVRPGAAFNAGVRVVNGSWLPYVDAEEQPQHFTARFLDGGGGAVMEVQGEFRPPFFLETGEETDLPLWVDNAPAPGRYTLELDIRSEVLGDRTFSFPLEVKEMADSLQLDMEEGRVEYAGDVPMSIGAPDGLLPIKFKVFNTGDAYWIVAKENKDEERRDPTGLVYVGIWWEQDGRPVWEEERCSIPCDVAPGQEVELSSLIRPPWTPGKYQLLVGLADEGFDTFGELLVLEVEVVNWAGVQEEAEAIPSG